MADITGTLTDLFVYPIKSCGGMRLSQAQLTPLGLLHDRQWLIVDHAGQFQTQRQIPHLAWIEPTVREQQLHLCAPELPDIALPFATSESRKMAVTIWNDQVQALDMGDAAAQWLDDFLEIPGRHFRLVQFDASKPRLSDEFWSKSPSAGLQFADGFAVNILSLASLRHFNERLMESGHEPVDVRRFRPNLLIDGIQAHEEDNIQSLRFQNNGRTLELKLVKPCPRCQIPDINPDTAIKEPEITETLIQYRQLPEMDHAVCFAINAIVKSDSIDPLKVGMQFEADYGFGERS